MYGVLLYVCTADTKSNTKKKKKKIIEGNRI